MITAVHPRHPARLLALSLAFLLSTLGAAGVATAAPKAEQPAAAAPAAKVVRATRPATVAERAAYADREQKAAPELAEFEGGDAIIIAGSTLGVILLVVLIVLLI